MRTHLAWILAGLTLMLVGCVGTSTRTSVVDVRSPINQSESDRAYKAVVLALMEQGFDIKVKDAETKLITTEYRKVAAVSGFPPFDFYLQLKAMVREMPGQGGEISLWPKMKEQNRFNQNAFTEHPLIAYSAEETKSGMNGRSEAMQKGQLLFQSLLDAISKTLGKEAGSFKRTTDTVEVLGL